jgi:hypothetical protein
MGRCNGFKGFFIQEPKISSGVASSGMPFNRAEGAAHVYGFKQDLEQRVMTNMEH